MPSISVTTTYLELPTRERFRPAFSADPELQRAYADGARRIRVHTRTLDRAYALANYQACGFTPYWVVTHERCIP
ncbi:MAG: hypothetical protein ACUVS4_13665 [Chloroflexaceae bacterium]